jgi:excisionase family DNA binding protein
VPTDDPEQLLTPAEASRLLGVTPDAVRQLANKGRLPVQRTLTGRRLFRRADVEKLVFERTLAARCDPDRRGGDGGDA